MVFSESSVLLLVYTGLIIFFLVPFQSDKSTKIPQQSLQTFKTVYKVSLMKMIFHKKAIFAFLLVIISLLFIWLGFSEADSHTNRHSGNPPISTKLEAIINMSMMLVYTLILYLSLALIRALKIEKSIR
ncbi:hypothetical protein [Sutcliffiella halmapala]|uniref:hypothetical protein n=1 Tax=Sutcliffiella halmapala TaxID=79882 RepID=UPI00099554BF|nr:hypothetical protein [Sutcliffiella halmapala]